MNKLQDEDSSISSPWGFSIVDTEKDTLKINIGVISGTPPNWGLAKSITKNLFNDSSLTLFNRLDGTLSRSEFYPIRGSLIPINDSIYVLGCSYNHYDATMSSQDTIKSGLIYYNKQGDSLYSRWFGISERFIIDGVDRINNNLFLSGTTKIMGDGQKAHVVKTDLQGNLIWEKTLTAFTSFYCNAGSISKVGSDGYFVEGIMNSHDVGPVHISNVGLYRLDTNGNIKWYKNLFNNANGGCYNVREDGTGNYFLSGCMDTTINTTDYYSNGFILKMDSSAHVIWMHVFNETPHILNNMWQYRILPNSDLIFCGEQLQDISTNVHVGILGRMDSSGHVLWEHYYKQNDSSDYNCLAEIKQMPDGGFIATGTCRDSLTKKQAVWLIRTDSNGCLVPGCVAPTSVEVFPNDKKNILVYPNPSGGDFILSCTKPLDKNASIKVSDITGKVIYTQPVQQGVYKTYISLHQPTGIYLLQLIDDKGKMMYTQKIQIE